MGTVLCHCGVPSGAPGMQQFVGFLCNNSWTEPLWLPFWSITHWNTGSEQLEVQLHDPTSVGSLPLSWKEGLTGDCYRGKTEQAGLAASQAFSQWGLSLSCFSPLHSLPKHPSVLSACSWTTLHCLPSPHVTAPPWNSCSTICSTTC